MVSDLHFRIQWWRCGCINRLSALWQSFLLQPWPWPCLVLLPGKQLGKWQAAGQIVKNSIPELVTLAPTAAFPPCVFSESSAFFLAGCFPKWPVLSSFLHGTLGMCSQNARFPPAPGSTTKEQLSGFATPTPSRGLGGPAFGTHLICAFEALLARPCILAQRSCRSCSYRCSSWGRLL